MSSRMNIYLNKIDIKKVLKWQQMKDSLNILPAWIGQTIKFKIQMSMKTNAVLTMAGKTQSTHP